MYHIILLSISSKYNFHLENCQLDIFERLSCFSYRWGNKIHKFPYHCSPRALEVFQLCVFPFVFVCFHSECIQDGPGPWSYKLQNFELCAFTVLTHITHILFG
uniref:Uncharacterized protein n=1 Tax=Cacopsylla melanoneura TaxID=428564 RepID=A0A8D8LR79_9HEMI